MFSFSYDPARVLLSVVQRHYWAMPVFRDFEREFLFHHDRIRLTRKHYRVLADCRDYPVQSTEVGEAFGRLFGKLMSENSGHYAIIASSTLNKMQAKRALPQANVQVFSDVDDAMRWLFTDDSVPK